MVYTRRSLSTSISEGVTESRIFYGETNKKINQIKSDGRSKLTKQGRPLPQMPEWEDGLDRSQSTSISGGVTESRIFYEETNKKINKIKSDGRSKLVKQGRPLPQMPEWEDGLDRSGSMAKSQKIRYMVEYPQEPTDYTYSRTPSYKLDAKTQPYYTMPNLKRSPLKDNTTREESKVTNSYRLDHLYERRTAIGSHETWYYRAWLFILTIIRTMLNIVTLRSVWRYLYQLFRQIIQLNRHRAVIDAQRRAATADTALSDIEEDYEVSRREREEPVKSAQRIVIQETVTRDVSKPEQGNLRRTDVITQEGTLPTTTETPVRRQSVIKRRTVTTSTPTRRSTRIAQMSVENQQEEKQHEEIQQHSVLRKVWYKLVYFWLSVLVALEHVFVTGPVAVASALKRSVLFLLAAPVWLIVKLLTLVTRVLVWPLEQITWLTAKFQESRDHERLQASMSQDELDDEAHDTESSMLSNCCSAVLRVVVRLLLLPVQLLGLVLWVMVWPLQQLTRLMAGFLHNRDLVRLDASFDQEDEEEDVASGVVTRSKAQKTVEAETSSYWILSSLSAAVGKTLMMPFVGLALLVKLVVWPLQKHTALMAGYFKLRNEERVEADIAAAEAEVIEVETREEASTEAGGAESRAATGKRPVHVTEHSTLTRRARRSGVTDNVDGLLKKSPLKAPGVEFSDTEQDMHERLDRSGLLTEDEERNKGSSCATTPFWCCCCLLPWLLLLGALAGLLSSCWLCPVVIPMFGGSVNNTTVFLPPPSAAPALDLKMIQAEIDTMLSARLKQSSADTDTKIKARQDAELQLQQSYDEHSTVLTGLRDQLQDLETRFSKYAAFSQSLSEKQEEQQQRSAEAVSHTSDETLRQLQDITAKLASLKAELTKKLEADMTELKTNILPDTARTEAQILVDKAVTDLEERMSSLTRDSARSEAELAASAAVKELRSQVVLDMQELSDKMTSTCTAAATDKAIEASEAATKVAIEVATKQVTAAAIEAATAAALRSVADRSVTSSSETTLVSESAIQSSVDTAVEQATDRATAVVIESATKTVIEAATREASESATAAVIMEASKAATKEATRQATEEAVSAAQKAIDLAVAQALKEIGEVSLKKSGDGTKHVQLDNSQIELHLSELRGSLEDWVRVYVSQVLAVYSADRTGKPDYALESAGGYVVSTRCTETYTSSHGLISVLGVPLWYMSNSPRTVIQPDNQPGNCWAFKGQTGFIVIHLSAKIHIDGITIEHIAKELATSGDIRSAPKDFEIVGLQSDSDYEGVPLDNFTYAEDGGPLQYFPIKSDTESAYEVIEVRITANHGHPDYTCIYRIRVHGHRL